MTHRASRLFRPFLTLIWGLAVVLLSFGAPTPVRAQDAAAAPAPAAAAPSKASKDVDVLEMLKDGGVTVWICLVISVLVMGFTIEGFLKLKFSKLAPAEQIAQLRQFIAYGQYQEAWAYCKGKRTFLAHVVAAGLERVGRGADAVEYALEETSAQQAVLLKTNMNYLSLIGVVAPMIGLTGTVFGMISAFHNLGSAGIGDPSGLAASIGEVLTSTAAGLLVAVPGFVFFYIFKSKALTAVMLTDGAIHHLFETIPYEQLSGAVIGEGAVGSGAGEDVSYAAAPEAA